MAPQAFTPGTNPVFAGKYSQAFAPKTPQEWLQYKQNLIKQGFDSADVNAAMQQFAPATPEGQLIGGLLPLMQKKLEQDVWSSSTEGMKAQLELARADAKEKAKQTLMWSTLAKLPESMANAVSPYGGPVGAAMAYQGMSAIPGIYSQTLASFPQIQTPGYSTQQYRYF